MIYDILFETKKQDIHGLLLSIDFQQAFDSVSWKFISKTLTILIFAPLLKGGVNYFKMEWKFCIRQNGFMSEFFYLQRGGRQGDPVSPYIFILCAEILSFMLRNEKSVKGIKIN